MKASKRLVLSRFVWNNASRDIQAWCQECEKCQAAKITTYPQTAPQSFPLGGRFENVHMDIVGPLPACSRTERYIVTFIDRETGWAEADPVDSITATDIARSFVRSWYQRFGTPLHVTTDRGKQFESELFSELSRLLGFWRIRTASYHPSANGKIERFHRTLKTALKARKGDWIDSLPLVMFAYRITPSSLENISPMQLVTGTTVNIAPGLITPGAKRFDLDYVKRLSECITNLQQSRWDSDGNAFEQTNVPGSLSKCTHVWVRVDRVRRPLEAPYCGPFPVLQRFPKTFLIEVNGKSDAVSIERLKPAKLSTKEPLPTKKPAQPFQGDPHADGGQATIPVTPDISDSDDIPRRSHRLRKKTVRFDL